MSIEALKLALGALDIVKIHFTQNRHVDEAITAIKQALNDTTEAQPTGKAPCERHCEANAFRIEIRGLRKRLEELQSTQETKKYKMVINGLREWVGLTDEEKHKIIWMFHQPGAMFKDYKYMEAVEAKLKEKNTT